MSVDGTATGDGWVTEEDVTISATDANAEAGDGGGTMDIYSDTRINQIEGLAVTDFTDNSTSGVPNGISDGKGSPWDKTLSNSEVSMSSTDEEAEAGDGGGVMDIWTDTRVNQLSGLVVGNLSNESSFTVPAGVVNGAANNWSSSYDNNEVALGTKVTALILDIDGTSFAGTASILVNGTVEQSKSVQGIHSVNAEPPSIVLTSSGVEDSSVEYKFTPSSGGIPYTQTITSRNVDIGSIQYGKVEGTVTDIDGNGVGEVVIQGKNTSVVTADDGTYTFPGPGGTSVTFRAIGDSVSQTIPSGSALTLDWEYGRITVTLKTPGGRPIKNTEVDIEDSSFLTNNQGEAELSNARIDTYTISVSGGKIEDEAVVTGQGVEVLKELGGETYAGAQITVYDATNGQEVNDVDITFGKGGTRAFTDLNGIARIITEVSEGNQIIVGQTDRRYQPKKLEKEITIGEDVEQGIKVERSGTIGTGI